MNVNVNVKMKWNRSNTVEIEFIESCNCQMCPGCHGYLHPAGCHGDVCYYTSNDTQSWMTSESQCGQEGMTLATFVTSDAATWAATSIEWVDSISSNITRNVSGPGLYKVHLSSHFWHGHQEYRLISPKRLEMGRNQYLVSQLSIFSDKLYTEH